MGRSVRERVGVPGSLNRRVLELCESVGLVLEDVRGLGHPSRQVLVFRSDGCMTEVTLEDLPLEREEHPSLTDAERNPRLAHGD